MMRLCHSEILCLFAKGTGLCDCCSTTDEVSTIKETRRTHTKHMNPKILNAHKRHAGTESFNINSL